MRTITIKGKDYQLRLTTKGCVKAESRIGENILNIFNEENKLPKLNDLLILLHESLIPLNHSITMEDVYDLYDSYLDEGGSMVSLIELLVGVMTDSGLIPESVKEAKN